MMRITASGKRISFTTNQFIEPKLWDKDRQRIKGTTPLVKQINDLLLTLRTSALNHYNDFIKKAIPVTPQAIRDLIFQKNKPAHTLLEAFTFHIQNLKTRVGFDTAINTVKKFQTTESKLKTFLPAIFGRADIHLFEINQKFIADFDLYMRSEGKLKNNTVVKNMMILKRVMYVCVQNGWLDKQPFGTYSCKLDETDRGYLTALELSLMENVQLPSKRLEQARDIFIFCCYTGLAYVDVSKLNHSHFEKQPDGSNWIKIARTKTQSKALIPMLPKAQAILNKYTDSISGIEQQKVLPIISNQNLNKYLKEVAEKCGVNKRVSMHLGRHTFATTVTLEKGIDITTISKMLGHKSVRYTQLYSKVTEMKIAADMQKLM